jgi:hypothetical protein
MAALDSGKLLTDPMDVHKKRRQPLIRGRSDSKAMLRKLVNEHYAFTFIRVPDKRAYSCFTDKILKAGDERWNAIRQFLTREYGMKLDDESGHDTDAIRQNFTRFMHFLADNLTTKPAIPRNDHWQLQSRIIRRSARDVPLAFIGLVEKLPSHLSHVVKMAKVEQPLPDTPRLNSSTHVSVSLESIMTPEIRKLLDNVYAEDFALYEDVSKRTSDIG